MGHVLLVSPASPLNAISVFLLRLRVLSSLAFKMVAPRIAALEAAMMVKSLPVMPSVPPSWCFGGLGFDVDTWSTSSNVCPIFSSHRASSEVAFCGLYTTECLKSFADSGGGDAAAGDVGDTTEPRDDDVG